MAPNVARTDNGDHPNLSFPMDRPIQFFPRLACVSTKIRVKRIRLDSSGSVRVALLWTCIPQQMKSLNPSRNMR